MLQCNAASHLNMRVVYILLSLFIFYNFPLYIVNNATSQYWLSIPKEKVHENMKLLSSCIAELIEGEPILITDERFEKSVSNKQQYYHQRQTALRVPCLALRYSYHFIAGLFSCRFSCLNFSECLVLPFYCVIN